MKTRLEQDFARIDVMYGVKCIRPASYSRVDELIEYSPQHIPHVLESRIATRCDYCGHPPGDGRHKCLNCGAPK